MFSLLEKNKMPAYLQIASELLDAIENGKYPRNTLLPSERILAKEHQVSSIVINRALNLLSERGTIEKIPRKGSFVRSPTTSKSSTKHLKTKILINGASSPKDVNERSGEFVKILSDEFSGIEFEYTENGGVNRNKDESAIGDIVISGERAFADFALDGRTTSLENLSKSLDLKDFYTTPIEACRFDGTLLGLPLNFNPSVLFCNMNVLEQTGVSENDLGNLTWNRFIDLCSAIKESNAATHPLGFFEYTSCWWENFFYTHGLNIIRDNHFETDIFTSDGFDAINVMKRLVNGNLSENLTIRRDALAILNDDAVGFVICNPRLLMELTKPENWFLTPIPMKKASVSAANAFILSINADSHNKTLCEDVLRFMLSEPFQLWLGAKKAIAPSLRLALQSTYSSPARSAMLGAAETAKMLPNHPTYWRVHDEIGKAVHRLLAGDKDIEKMEWEINEKLYQEHKKWGSMSLLGIA